MNSPNTQFNTKILYNNCSQALNSFILHKCLAFYESQTPKKTYRILLNDVYQSATINIHKICGDKPGVDMKRLIDKAEITIEEKDKLKARWTSLLIEYGQIIEWVKKDRHNQVAHTSRSLESYLKSTKPFDEYRNIEKLLLEIKSYIESLPWFNESVPAIQKTLTSKEIEKDLCLKTRREIKRAEMQAILNHLNELKE